MNKEEFEILIDKKAQELACLAVDMNTITDIQCPRNVVNPGLYFGFILGARQAYEVLNDNQDYLWEGWE